MMETRKHPSGLKLPLLQDRLQAHPMHPREGDRPLPALLARYSTGGLGEGGSEGEGEGDAVGREGEMEVEGGL